MCTFPLKDIFSLLPTSSFAPLYNYCVSVWTEEIGAADFRSQVSVGSHCTLPKKWVKAIFMDDPSKRLGWDTSMATSWKSFNMLLVILSKSKVPCAVFDKGITQPPVHQQLQHSSLRPSKTTLLTLGSYSDLLTHLKYHVLYIHCWRTSWTWSPSAFASSR